MTKVPASQENLSHHPWITSLLLPAPYSDLDLNLNRIRKSSNGKAKVSHNAQKAIESRQHTSSSNLEKTSQWRRREKKSRSQEKQSFDSRRICANYSILPSLHPPTPSTPSARNRVPIHVYSFQKISHAMKRPRENNGVSWKENYK